MGSSWKEVLADRSLGQGLVTEASSSSKIFLGGSVVRSAELLRVLTPLLRERQGAQFLKSMKVEQAPRSTIDLAPNKGATKSEQRPPRWKTCELLVLIAAKGSEIERSSVLPLDDAMKTADTRWRAVAEFCVGKGVMRTASQCRSRWEKLLTDFNKIHHYHKNISTGLQGYFEMSRDERLTRKLPLNFKHECYEFMEVWIPARCAAALHPHKIVDPPAKQIVEPPASPDDDLHDTDKHQLVRASPQNGNVRDDSDAIDISAEEAGFCEDVFPHKQARTEAEPSTEVIPISNMTQYTTRASDVRGRKRKRREKSRDSSMRMIANLLEIIAQESVKRNIQEAAYMRVAERKLAFKKRRHGEQLAQASAIASDTIRALKEVTAVLKASEASRE